MFAAVEVGQLVDVVWVSFVAAVVVTTIFAVVVRETGRAAEARRTRQGNAPLHLGIAALGVVVFAAVVIVGVVVMLNK